MHCPALVDGGHTAQYNEEWCSHKTTVLPQQWSEKLFVKTLLTCLLLSVCYYWQKDVKIYLPFTYTQ